MKKLLIFSAALLWSSFAHAFSPVRYVQISTNTLTKQTGAFNVNAGSFTLVNTASATITSTFTATAGTITTLTAPTINETNLAGTVADATVATHSAAHTFNSTVSMIGVVTATNTSNTFGSSNSTFTTVNVTTIVNGGVTAVNVSTFGVQVLGTNAANNAPAGFVGEYISSSNLNANFPSTGNWGDNVSITLTPGDWDITTFIEGFANGATVTAFLTGVSTTTGNNSAGLTSGINRTSCYLPTAANNTGGGLPRYRVQPTANSTYFLKVDAAFSAATPQYSSTISARRVR